MTPTIWREQYGLSDTEIELLERIGTMCDEQFEAMAEQWQEQRVHCIDALRAVAKTGLLGLEVPASAGGLNMSFRCKVALAERLAAVDFGLSMAVINTHNTAARLCSNAPSHLIETYVPDLLAARRIGCTALTEPQAGSDFAAITTEAQQTAQGWRINGHKAWITNAVAADVVILYAQTQPGSGAKGVGGFVIDGRRDGFERQPPHGVVGLQSIGAGGFLLNNYLASKAELILPPGTGFKTALTSINGARIYVAAMCCGMLQSALDHVGRWGRERTSFGQPLHGHQGWRWILSEADAELAAARALIARASQQLDADQDTQLIAAQSKVFATRMASRHITALMQAMGAEGLLTKYPFGRHLVGVQMAGLVDGSTQMLLERISARNQALSGR